MSNNDHYSGPTILAEHRVEAPFGKRLYDQAFIRKLQGVARSRFWGVVTVIIVILILLLIAPSDRVYKLTPRPIEFENSNNSIQLDGAGENILIPPLVLEFQKIIIRAGQESRAKTLPIQVLNFSGVNEIPPGSEVKAILLTGATNGLVKAKLSEPLKVNGASIFDAGVVLIGQGRSSDSRLYIEFRKAVFRDGKSISISAQGYDLSDSIVGLKGSRVGDQTLKLVASSGLYFLSGMATGMREPEYDANGRGKRPSVGDAALNGVAQASGEQAKSYMEDVKNRAPMIEVKIGSPFLVTFD